MKGKIQSYTARAKRNLLRNSWNKNPRQSQPVVHTSDVPYVLVGFFHGLSQKDDEVRFARAGFLELAQARNPLVTVLEFKVRNGERSSLLDSVCNKFS